MTIEDKKQKIKEYCNSMRACAYCNLHWKEVESEVISKEE